ncbi:MAG: glycosyl transferase family 2, partial [Bacteroidaceae bacterium]|nr:glycosyl transferase family 2 [Bacteroidaceae bacterium]
MEFIPNSILPHIHFWTIRRAYLKMVRAKIGKGTFIMKNVYIQSPNRLTIGSGSHINRGVVLDARGDIIIGASVSVSHNVNIMTGSHDHRSKYFTGEFTPIVIKDYAWIGVGATILQGVTIGKGAVV